ncbi:hypothetical protein V8F20_002694 [Naviculisporaceae sp. PSN 640]
MAGSILLRSAYHHRLVGYGDFLRKHATPAADTQSASGRVWKEGADGANVATASSFRASEAQTIPGPASQALGAVPATQGVNPSLGMGLQTVAVAPSGELRQETMASAAEGTKAQGNNNNKKQHSCKCGICDACTETPSPPPPTCHHVACHSQRECTIFRGHEPARFVHPDNRRTAKLAWLPNHFWAKEAPAQSEQVSLIKATFKLDEDRELITSITSAVVSGIRSLERQDANRTRQWKSRRFLDIGEDLFKAELLTKDFPLYDLVSSHFDGDSPSAPLAPSSSNDDEDDEDEAMLRFQALLICSTRVDKMVSEGEITEEQKPQVLFEQVEKVLRGLGKKPKGNKVAGKNRPTSNRPAHAQFRDERLEMAKARAARSVRPAAHGSEPKVRSRLSGEVWNASPTKPASRDDDMVDCDAKVLSASKNVSDPVSERDNKQDATDDIIGYLSAMGKTASYSGPESIPNPKSERDDKQGGIGDIIAFLSAMGTSASYSAPESKASDSQVMFRPATVETVVEREESDNRQGHVPSNDKTKRSSTIVSERSGADPNSDNANSLNGQPKSSQVVALETAIPNQQSKPKPGGETSRHADQNDDSDEEEVILFKGRRRRY